MKEWDHLGDRGVEGGNIKMELQEVELCGMDWIELAQDRNSGGHFYCSNEPSCSIIWGEFLD